MLVAAAILSVTLLTSCGASTLRSERVLDDWSRGEALGKAVVNERVALACDGSGENKYVVWITAQESQGPQSLHLAHLDRTGRALAQRDLSIVSERPSQVGLVLGLDNSLHLTWVDRWEGVRRLLYARLDGSGTLLSDPMPISLPGLEVDSHTTGLNPKGGLEVFWSAIEGEKAGLYHLRLGNQGEVSQENLPLGRKGFDPAFRIDREGLIHLVWQEEPKYREYSVYYATLRGEESAIEAASELASFPLGMGTIAHPPSLGLAGEDVYVFWSVERRGGGLAPPSGEAYYLVFPKGEPGWGGAPRQVAIPPFNYPQYEQVESRFDLHELAGTDSEVMPSQFVYTPSATQGQYDELAVAYSVQLIGRTQSIIQVILTLWGEGELKGYQIAASTPTSSLKPVLTNDAQGELHLTWIDAAGFGAFDVFYASTAPLVRQRLNRVTGQDIMERTFAVMWGAVQAVGFIPIVFAWSFLPLFLIALYLFIRVEGALSRRGPRIVLTLSVVLYTGFKYLFRPGWLAALPLPRGLPATLAEAIIYVAPLLIAVLAGLVVWAYGRKREAASLLPAFAIFVACDALLTLLLYVPGILAE